MRLNGQFPEFVSHSSNILWRDKNIPSGQAVPWFLSMTPHFSLLMRE
jgi:hypothetical protein